ncbi:MAG TPA: DUF3810 family protein [Deltaproteobacteria bacterium]|nr:DUF3810 family protein [Deltaproteobacteria bacterium]
MLRGMERIVIPGLATYSPVALTDLAVGAPLAARVLLGATLPGRVVQTAAVGVYAASAARDWVARMGIRPIDFQEAFGADVTTLQPMSPEERRAEIGALSEALNEGYTDAGPPRAALAQQINQHLTAYISQITGQEIVTSSEVRSFNLAKVVFPFAYGTCDIISGDVAIFKDTGVLEPHVIAHEFCHRKGYLKELHAQALAYLAMRASGDPVLVQGARAERLHRQLHVLACGDRARFNELVDHAGLRPELRAAFHQLRPAPGAYESAVGKAMRGLYDKRMQWTGQNGLSDYDEGFTNLLWTFAHSERATQPREHAAI